MHSTMPATELKTRRLADIVRDITSRVKVSDDFPILVSKKAHELEKKEQARRNVPVERRGA